MKRVARVRGIDLTYEEHGRGFPVVLLHGFPFNRTMWREQVDALKESCRIITPDLRGFGETGVTPEPATMEQMAQDVAALLDDLDIKRAVIGGLSMGGYVTLAFYRLFPLRVRGLVLADTRAEADTEEARQNRELTARRALEQGMHAIAEAMMPRLLAPATFSDRPDVVERVRSMIVATNPKGAAAASRGMALRRDQTGLLFNIIAPTLLLVGSEDVLTPPPLSEAMRREIRGSRLHIIEGAAHVSNLERAEEFTKALGQFLRDIQP